ncbi:hypothetical protein BZZ01_16305 [Nostocales cyanobacterium HT-58-2]|nr:hypothetical protein BZZ01_16305 [Nostocales cyanobacterium HT-58-2]
MTPICNNECTRDNCPFMTDPYNPNRRVCVKCGQDYFFRRNGLSNFFVMAGLLVCILLIMRALISNSPQTTDSEPEMPATVQSWQ